MARTSASQAEDRGSNPLGATKNFSMLEKFFKFVFWVLVIFGTIFYIDFLIQKHKPEFEKTLEPLLTQTKEIKSELEKLKESAEKEILPPVQKPKKQVLSPKPLIKIEKEKAVEGILTKEGIISQTNAQREKFGLPPLKESEILNLSAKMKLEDMFEKQYFSHDSPTGETLEDLMKKVNYEYIVVGENLAMGNFESDKEVIEAWMQSPGHRENILNSRYQEIGVAVKQGIFQGKKIWIAVQHFGKPLSACKKPSEKMRSQIEKNIAQLKEMEEKLNSLKEEAEKTKDPQKIEEYNLLVSEYNSLLKKTLSMIEKYNFEVKKFNECVEK
jgi:uncharacterized protein YkwD